MNDFTVLASHRVARHGPLWREAADDFHHGWLFGEALENKDITKS